MYGRDECPLCSNKEVDTPHLYSHNLRCGVESSRVTARCQLSALYIVCKSETQGQLSRRGGGTCSAFGLLFLGSRDKSCPVAEKIIHAGLQKENLLHFFFKNSNFFPPKFVFFLQQPGSRSGSENYLSGSDSLSGKKP
jgi:hypothetical protein